MGWTLLFLTAVAAVIVLGRKLFHKDGSNAAKLMDTYRVMTADLLDNTPDEQLIRAVVANLLAKAEDARMDAYAVIPTLSQERCAVYSVWLFMQELRVNPAALRQGNQFGFSELAADGLDLLGFESIATDLRDYLQTADEVRADAMREAVNTADLDSALVQLVRHHADAFCDGSDSEHPQIGD